MNHKLKLSLLGAVAALLVATYLFIDISGNWEYVLLRRGKKILGMVLTGSAIAFSTVVFQTITHNRILTPSIIGLDSLYMLLQTVIVFFFGSIALANMSKQAHFLLTIVLMVMFAMLLYHFMFRRQGQNIYFLLLIGIICGTFFSSISSFLQMLIDPNEFVVVQDRMFASINKINEDILLMATIGIFAVGLYFLKFSKYLDVLLLGREQAVNLGVDYDYVVKRMLIVVAILISISTALVGPITFLGLLVANIAYQFMKGYQHKYVIPGAMFISIIALVGGQLVVERLLSFSTPLSVIINFIGGVYFIYLLLKENKKW